MDKDSAAPMGIPREVKVGVFVLAGLLAAGVVIFLIGEERGLFAASVSYQIVFKDVQGLKGGSAVRMGGVDVGSVTNVGYSGDSNDARLYVSISVAKDEARRIRQDSYAVVDSKGLLGDKMVTIVSGSPQKPPIPPGANIPSRENRAFESMLDQATEIGNKAERVLGNLESTTGTLATEQFRQDLESSMHSAKGILESVDRGPGYVSKLLRDPEEAERLSRAVTGLEKASQQLAEAVGRVNAVVARVEQGPGFAHDLIYSSGPSESVNHFGEAAHEAALTLKGIREGNGLAKSLIYGDDRTQELMGNLNATSRDIRQMVADVRAGKGTLGALLVDPSVYEDVKILLGNIDRNQALRALVRYSIKRDETPRKVEVTDPAPAKAPGK
jgi:phospholipid/cholesterol/gamma-HCH transport system substrate-binding protein